MDFDKPVLTDGIRYQQRLVLFAESLPKQTLSGI